MLSTLAPRKFNPTTKGYNVSRDVLASTWGTAISVGWEIAVLWMCDTGRLHLDGYDANQEVGRAGGGDGAFLGPSAMRNVAVMLLIPYWVEGHFYFTHRALHIDKPYLRLYK